MLPDRVPLRTVPEVALRLGVPVSWVYAKVEAGELPHIKLGRYVRFDEAEVLRYLDAQRRGPQP